MRCAIEALNKKNGNWECFGISTAEQSYNVFSRIADVRNSEKEDDYIEPIDMPRGLPAGISTVTQTWLDDCGLYHSSTWLDRNELESLDEWLLENHNTSLWDFLNFNHLCYLFDFKDGWRKSVFTRYNNLRVLFFFDG